jgi:hypothetical protein
MNAPIAIVAAIAGITVHAITNLTSVRSVTFTPFGGTAQHNTLTATARGTASGSLSIPGAMTHSDSWSIIAMARHSG